MPIISSGSTPSAQAKTSPWWIVYFQITHAGAPVTAQGFNQFFVIQAPNKAVAKSNIMKQNGADVTSVSGPFSSKAAANAEANKQAQAHSVNPNILGPVEGWLGSIGGMIASGIESGLVSFFGDLWTVIQGPLEIIAGVLVAIAVLAIYFKDDIAAAAMMAA